MSLAGVVTEPKLNSVVVLAWIAWVDNIEAAVRGRIHREDNIRTGQRLEMLVSHINFPAFDLLKDADGNHVLIIAGSSVPAVKGVSVKAETWPPEMFPS